MDIDTRQARRFLIVAEEGSYTRAAERLHVSQSSLTRAVIAIEQAAGVKLLERTTRRVELTDAGTKIKGGLQRWLQDFDMMIPADRGHRSLRLGFSWMLPDIWTEYTVRNFEADTGSRVEFIRDDSRYAGVDSGNADVVVVRGSRNVVGLQAVPLFQEHRVLAVRKDSLLARRQRVGWIEVVRHPLVINEGSGTTMPSDWPSGRQPTVSARCRNLDEWIESIAAGRGVGVTTLSVPRRISHPLVQFLPFDAAPKVQVYLAYPYQGSHPLVGRFVRAALRAVGQIRSAVRSADGRCGRSSGH